jgi:hypothetical protein
VRNAEGWVVSEPARLWVVPTATNFIKGNYTNSTGQRLPYFYLLPANYDAGRSYPLYCGFHGSPGDEGMITNAVPGGPGYANMRALKTMTSYRQQTRDPVILLWPTRRTGDGSWSDAYLLLVSEMLDKLLTEVKPIFDSLKRCLPDFEWLAKTTSGLGTTLPTLPAIGIMPSPATSVAGQRLRP